MCVLMGSDEKATTFPIIRLCGCFFGKCWGAVNVRGAYNKSQSTSPVNAIIILEAVEAVLE